MEAATPVPLRAIREHQWSAAPASPASARAPFAIAPPARPFIEADLVHRVLETYLEAIDSKTAPIIHDIDS